jgi:hypothetical protein
LGGGGGGGRSGAKSYDNKKAWFSSLYSCSIVEGCDKICTKLEKKDKKT